MKRPVARHGRTGMGSSAQRWYRFLQILVCLPVVIASIHYIALGYYPINDDAYMAMSGWDVFTGHWPTQGAHSTSAANTGVEVHHPGPLYYYLLAPALLLGKSGYSLVIGQALISVACGLGALAVARRIGATAFVTAIACAWVFTGVQLGHGLFARGFNPFPPVLILPLLLLATLGLILEEYWLLPIWVFASALSVQPHIGNLPLVCSLTLVLAVVGLLRWWRRRGAVWPLPGWRRRAHASQRKHFLRALLVAVAVWLPSIIELITYRPNNLTQLIKFLQATPIKPGIGLGKSVPLVLEVGTGWERGVARGSDIVFGHPVAMFTPGVVAGAVLMVAVLVLPWFGRSDRQTAKRLALWAALLDGALAVFAVGIAQLTRVGLIEWEYVQLPAAWSLLWCTLVLELLWLARLHGVADRLTFIRRVRTPAVRRVMIPVVAVALVAVVFNAPAKVDNAMIENGRNAHAALPVLEREVRRLGGANASIIFSGDSIGSSYDMGWALAYGLLRDGYHPHIATFGSLPEYWDYRKYTTAPRDAVHVYITYKKTFPTGFVPSGMTPAFLLRGAGTLEYQVFVFLRTPETRW